MARRRGVNGGRGGHVASVPTSRASEGADVILNSSNNGSNGDDNETSQLHPNSGFVSNNDISQNPPLLEERRQLSILIGFKFDKPSECAREITKSFKEKIDSQGYTWTKVSETTKNFYFEEFKKHYVWDPKHEKTVRTAWDLKASVRYTDLLRDVRSESEKPTFLTDETWLSFTTYWETPKYKQKREINSQNRLKGEGSSTHTGGSLSFIEHATKLESILERPPTEFELFLHTHTTGHDNQTFVNEKSRAINDNMLRLRQEYEANRATEDGDSRPLNESALYYEAAGGKNKAGVYGVGSKASDYYLKSGKKVAPTTFSPQDEVWENRYFGMERKVRKLTRKTDAMKQTLEIVCRRLGIPTLDFDTDTEDDDRGESGGQTRQNPTTSGSEEGGGFESGDYEMRGFEG